MHGSGWTWLESTASIDLNEENARLRSVLGHCPKCIAVLDEDGALVGYNREFMGLFASPPPVGEKIATLFEAHARAMLEQVIAVAGTKQRAGAIVSMRSTDGEDREIEFLVATLNGEGARSIGVVLAADDRSGPIREEAEQHALARNIGDANRDGAINLAQASLCHDINNAMTTAGLAIEALGEHPGLARDAEVSDLLKSVAESVQQTTAIIKRVTAASRPSVTQSARTDVRECIERAVRVVAPLARLGRVSMGIDVRSDASVALTGTELTQVLTNLLTNSVHAIEDAHRPGRVDVTLDLATPGNVTLCVRDDGVGIEPSRLMDSFEAFETTRATRGGTGLGLAISRTIVEAAGGRIDVLSAPGRATEMRLELPAVPRQQVA